MSDDDIVKKAIKDFLMGREDIKSCTVSMLSHILCVRVVWDTQPQLISIKTARKVHFFGVSRPQRLQACRALYNRLEAHNRWANESVI